MEKGNRPPPDTEGTSKIPDIPAPPYPGPPLDPRVLTGQPNHPAAQKNAQYDNQPVSKSVHQEHSQDVNQQNSQPSTQPVGQQSAQPLSNQLCSILPQHNKIRFFTQVLALLFDPVLREWLQGCAAFLPAVQQRSARNQVLLVQHMPTDVAGTMLCPHCKNTVVTTIEYKVGMLTWIIFGVLLCWPCSFIPFCVNSCKDVQHSCPQCNNVLHLYKR
ncbi:hypothetical protein CCH79_00012670, partial [Gambusia affinis]